MCRLRSAARSACHAILLAFALLPTTLPTLTPEAAAADATRLLEVYLNGFQTHLLVELIDRDGRLLARADDAAQIGLAVPEVGGVRPRPTDLVTLQEIPGLICVIDERRQQLRLTAQDRALRVQQINSGAGRHDGSASSGFGTVLNYDIQAQAASGGARLVSGTFDARSFSPWGTLGSGWITQLGSEATSPLIRLDSEISREDPASLQRYQLGDSIAGGLDWTRPYRLGGIQIASNFSLRPDLVTFPVPQLAGHADVASTMDLFVNGVQALSHPVSPGPFQLQQPPLVTGAGDLAVVVRDANGHESVQTLNFYTSPSLLAPGLNSYSAEAGWMRQNYGLVDDSYTRPAGSATLRRGLTRWLTVEGHAEVSQAAMMGGAGSTFSVAGLALADVSMAASDSSLTGIRPGGSGMQYGAGLQRQGRWLSFSASTTRATSGFRDVSSNSLSVPPRRLDRLELGLSFGRFGSFHATYNSISSGSMNSLVSNNAVIGLEETSATVFSLSYSKPISNRLQMYATAYREVGQVGGDGMTFGLVVPLGQRSSASVTAGMDGATPAYSAEIQQAALRPGDVGWSALVNQDANARQSGDVSYMSQFGTVSAEVDHVAGQTGVRGELGGSVIAMPQGVFTGNRVNDSFAVVDTNGLSGVTVDLENRPVGRTNSEGLLLVPDLNGWQINRLSLDPGDLPADADINSLHREIVLPERSGQLVVFDITRGHTAVVRLVDEKGVPVEAGSMATLLGSGRRSPVGFDGEVFFKRLQPKNRIHVETATGQCHSEFAFVPIKNSMPVIGPVRCIADRP